MLNLEEKWVRCSKSQKSQQIKIGDIVILRKDDTACGLWKLAKVAELLKERDSMIQSAKVQMLSKNKVTDLQRPIQHLMPLEAN